MPEVERHSSMSAVSVLEIHEYSLRPECVEEPLWDTPEWRRSVADHLAASRWLCRASEIPFHGSTQAAHAKYEPVYVLVRARGSFVVRCERLRGGSGRERSWRKRRVEEVLDLWREVREWWRLDEAVDRLVVRVLLSSGVVVDLARYRQDEWSLVGIVD